MRTLLSTLAALLCAAVPAHAQVARLSAAVNVVTLAPPDSEAFARARSGAGIDAGGRLRTGGRSRAAIRFEDRSLLAVNELSEVVVASGRQRDVRLVRGQLMGDFKSPGTVTGGYASAAIRGTKVIVIEDPENRQTIVENYEGETVVTAPGVRLRSGRAAPPPDQNGVFGRDASAPADRFTHPHLIGDAFDWTGATLRILAGTGAGEERRVAGFDPATGTVTFEPPLDAGLDHTSVYLLTNDPQAPVADLQPGEGVRFRDGLPVDRFRVGPLQYARGEKTPWFEPLTELPDDPRLQRALARLLTARTFTQDAAYEDRARDDGTQSRAGRLLRVANANETDTVRRPRRPRGETGDPVQDPVRAPLFPAGGAPGGPALPGGAAALAHSSGARLPVTPGEELVLRLEPFAMASRGSETYGIRTRLSAATGSLFVEVGGLFRREDRRSRSDLSELYAVYKAGGAGEFRAGRQPLFLSPAQNLTLGALLGFETTDAALWRSPWLGVYRVEAGYVADSSGYLGDGFSGWFGRVQRPLLGGALGANVLTANRAGTQVGWSADLAVPVGDDLHLYGEAGRDPFHNNLYTAGAYFPQLYQRAGLDVFLEYATRRGLPQEVGPERLQLRVRRSVAGRFHAIGFLDQEIGGRLRPGGGFVFSQAFR